MSIYTRTGDHGESGLVGGQRLSKSDLRLHAIGTVDELNASLGLVNADGALPSPLDVQLCELQHVLFRIGADLATVDRAGAVPPHHRQVVALLEQWIDGLQLELSPLQRFILPGGSRCGALLHNARTICRRSERWIVALHEREPVTPGLLPIINRLGDYLFVAARFANAAHHVSDVPAHTHAAGGQMISANG